jgi:hypothetical protein
MLLEDDSESDESSQTVEIKVSKVFNVECRVQQDILLLNFFPASFRFLTAFPTKLIKQEPREVWGCRHERLEGLERSEGQATVASENNVDEESGFEDEFSSLQPPSRRHTEISLLWTGVKRLSLAPV